MRTRRLLITSFVVLAVGVYLICNYCNGSTGFSFAYPVSGSSLKIDITTTGLPALAGVPLAVLGLLLLTSSVVAALVGEIQTLRAKRKPAEKINLPETRNSDPDPVS
jgi:uncharacterized membrane protein